MSIEKKSLISTLKTAKKANVASTTPDPSRVVSKVVKSQKISKLLRKSSRIVKRAQE